MTEMEQLREYAKQWEGMTINQTLQAVVMAILFIVIVILKG